MEPSTPQVAQEREDVLADDREHLGRRQVLEPAPAIIGVGPAPVVSAVGEDRAGHRFAEAVGPVLLEGLEIVEALEEQEVGELLHDFERVGDPARPERVPDAVDLGADVTGQHSLGPLKRRRSCRN